LFYKSLPLLPPHGEVAHYSTLRCLNKIITLAPGRFCQLHTRKWFAYSISSLNSITLTSLCFVLY
jgi:hypothetical protein